MRKDYHMHPTVLKAPELFARYAQTALANGIDEICVTDHMPLSISRAKDRLERGSVRAYCARVRELAKQYEGRLSVKCGIEIDYHPSVTDEVDEVLEAGEFDYILGSSHMHLFIKDFASYSRNDFAALALENALRAVQSGKFSALSHPDMYRFAFLRPDRFPLVDDGYDVLRHKDLIDELLQAVKQKGMYLEINPHLAADKGDLLYTYPQVQILEWALARDVRFSYGSDAHVPEHVGVLLRELERHPVYGKALADWENTRI